MKEKKYYNKFNKDFEIGQHQKTILKKKVSDSKSVLCLMTEYSKFVWISIWTWWGYGNHFCNCFTTLFWEIVLVWGPTWKKKLELKSGEKLIFLENSWFFTLMSVWLLWSMSAMAGRTHRAWSKYIFCCKALCVTYIKCWGKKSNKQVHSGLRFLCVRDESLAY